jgi:hypothetical protein
MPTVKLNDLNNLKGTSSSFAGSLNEGQQTVDKVKDIINGINNILTKVQGFRPQQQTQAPQSTPAQVQNIPSDMQITQRAIIDINDAKIISFLKELKNQIPDFYKEKPLKEILEMGEGNEQIIKAFVIQIIKETTSVRYV